MNETAKLGSLIDSDQGRDAIHIAIVPVTAHQKLSPGQDVGLIGEETVGPSDSPIGIIDPFLKGAVPKGERCWLLLYPGTITSLRHEWTHPAFGVESKPDAAESRKWLEDYAKALGSDYAEVMSHAKSYLEYHNYWTEGGRFEGEYVPEDFWNHYQAVTGIVVGDTQRGSFFSCSC